MTLERRPMFLDREERPAILRPDEKLVLADDADFIVERGTDPKTGLTWIRRTHKSIYGRRSPPARSATATPRKPRSRAELEYQFRRLILDL